jgi:CheY-like chemotaxis protein
VARILIVEAILERAGHEIVFAQNGEEALQQFQATAIDLVVTDLHLPEVHGFELITVLRDVDPRPAVIAVSGTGQFQLHMAEALGAKWTIAKPVDPELLLKAVEGALVGEEPPEDATAT